MSARPGRNLQASAPSEPGSTPSLRVVFTAPADAPAAPWRSRTPVAVLSRLYRLYRAPEWLHILPLPLATFDANVPLGTALLAAGRGIANAFGILAFGFLLNAVSDRYVDRDARKNPLLLPNHGGYKTSLVVLPAISVALAALSPWPVQLATAWCLTLACVYSIGPRLKAIPVVGTLTDAAGFAPILFLGMAGSSLPVGFSIIAVIFAALLLQNQLIHESGDREDDAASGLRTTWLTLGPRWTALLAACAGTVATVATAVTDAGLRSVSVVGIVGAAFVVVFPLLLVWDGLTPVRARRLRVVHRWCALVVGATLYVTWRHFL